MSNAASLPDLSLYQRILSEFGPSVPPLVCTKATLTHLSHTLENLVLSHGLNTLLFAGFQELAYLRVESRRYRQLADVARLVCVFAAGEPPREHDPHELVVPLPPTDPLRQEWFLVVLSPLFSVVMTGRDLREPAATEAERCFETIWSFEPAPVACALDTLVQVITAYRPDRAADLRRALDGLRPDLPDPALITRFTYEMIRFEEQLHRSLRQTSNQLDQQLRWRDDLTATLVHDMRVPLQGIVLSLDMLARGRAFDQSTLDELLMIVQRDADLLSTMVQLIADTNQLAAGQIGVHWQLLDTERLVEESLGPLRHQFMRQQHELSVRIDRRVRALWGDAVLLGRVLQNLLGNAAKFTPSGGQISISIAPVLGGTRIELTVRDNGPGIASTVLPYIFERYYQGSTRDQRGSGLGLYFCRLATEAHGGSIRADSQPGEGTAITLSLPARPPLAL